MPRYETKPNTHNAFWDSFGEPIDRQSLCVDMTGFIRPYLIFLLRWFMQNGIQRFDALYLNLFATEDARRHGSRTSL